jgi:transglutaminase-like putative cysteine protease
MADETDLARWLAPTPSIDSDAPNVRAFAARVTADAVDDVAKAVALYYAVRDGIVYTPYCDFRDPATFRASAVLEKGAGFCVGKSSVLAAAARAAGIPARPGFADVKNHLSTPRLRAKMNGTDIFYFHGYVELRLAGRWVKATPAFDRTLCDKFGVHPLEFDGAEDSLFHPYDRSGRRHMEYVNDRGVTADIPVDEIIETFARFYPGLDRQTAPATAFRTEAEQARGSSG